MRHLLLALLGATLFVGMTTEAATGLWRTIDDSSGEPRSIVEIADRDGVLVGRKLPAQIETEVSRHLQALTDLLGPRDWLVGSHLGVADPAVFAQPVCIRGAVEGGRLVMADYPAVAAWMDRVDAASSA